MFPTSNKGNDLFLDDIFASNTALENQLTGDASCESSGLIINSMGKREQKLAAIPEVNDDENSNKKNPKAFPKEIERKRRQEMATLHSSLRSLLPLEYIRVIESTLFSLRLKII